MDKDQLIAELVASLTSLLKHSEGTNHAFFVAGKRSALQTAFAGQKELLQQARAALAKAGQSNA